MRKVHLVAIGFGGGMLAGLLIFETIKMLMHAMSSGMGM